MFKGSKTIVRFNHYPTDVEKLWKAAPLLDASFNMDVAVKSISSNSIDNCIIGDDQSVVKDDNSSQ